MALDSALLGNAGADLTDRQVDTRKKDAGGNEKTTEKGTADGWMKD